MVFEDIIKKEWQLVKNKFVPKVGGVIISEEKTMSTGDRNIEVPTAAYCPFDRTIIINPNFVKEIVDHSGLTPEEAVRAILFHEIGHERYFPMNAKTMITLGAFGSTNFPEIPLFDNIYSDVVDNVKNILCSNGEELLKLYTGKTTQGQKDAKDPVMSLLTDYYKLRSRHVDENILDAELKKGSSQDYFAPYLKRLIGIPFIQEDGRVFKNSATDEESISLHKSLMWRFGFVLRDFIKDEKTKQQMQQNQQGSKGKKESQQQGQFPREGNQPGEGALGDLTFSEEEIRNAMKDVAREGSREDYENAKKYVKEKLGIDLDKEEKAMAKSIGIGGGKLAYHPEAVVYHHTIASGLPVYIQKKPMVADADDSYPDHNVEFNIGDSVKKLNIFNSGGKILPSITQRMEENDGQAIKDLDVPHVLIMLDCSGSMPAITSKSVPLVCAYVMAINYHMNGSYIGAAVFGGDTYILPFTRNLFDVERHLSIFDGGGTTIDFKKVKELIPLPKMKDFKLENASEEDVKKFLKEQGQYEKALNKNVRIKNSGFVLDDLNSLDIYVVTDGGISNLGETLTYLHESAKYARTCILHTGSRFDFDKKTFPPNVSLIPVDKEKEIMQVTFGLLKQQFAKEK
ncbi:hypothetical protein HY643_05055 [Candidatus Woesearchaeota archaeon]|nr:hypothetical protein [Candidatus Woesearchaeota archaeon]